METSKAYKKIGSGDRTNAKLKPYVDSPKTIPT